MRESKRILLIITAIVVLLIGIILFYYSPALTMNVAKTGQVNNTDIFTVKNGMGNMFFIKTGNGYILIDAGLDSKGLEKTLKDAGIKAGDVRWIFLTHSDADHTGTLPLFKNAVIHMSDDEFCLIDGTAVRMLFMKNAMPRGIDIGKIVLLGSGQKLSLNGTEIECIKAPGHTAGSMMYRIDGKYLFTGDAFRIRNGNIGVHPYTMNSNQSRETIEKSKKIIDNSRIVLTSHYGLH